MTVVRIYNLDQVERLFDDIDRVSFVNHESFGTVEKLVPTHRAGDTTLVVNVNAITAAVIEG